MAEPEILGGDIADISTLSYLCCNICGRKIFSGQSRKSCGGVILCLYCYVAD
jgi:hypothetical protein